MLVLTRKKTEEVILEFDRPTLERLLAEQAEGFVVRVLLVNATKGRAKLGIDAPTAVGVQRKELRI